MLGLIDVCLVDGDWNYEFVYVGVFVEEVVDVGMVGFDGDCDGVVVGGYDDFGYDYVFGNVGCDVDEEFVGGCCDRCGEC